MSRDQNAPWGGGGSRLRESSQEENPSFMTSVLVSIFVDVLVLYWYVYCTYIGCYTGQQLIANDS